MTLFITCICDLYITHLRFPYRTFAIYKLHIYDLYTICNLYIESNVPAIYKSQTIHPQFINRKDKSNFAIDKSQRGVICDLSQRQVVAIYKSQRQDVCDYKSQRQAVCDL